MIGSIHELSGDDRMKLRFSYLRPFDFFAALLVLGLIVIAAVVAYSGGGGGTLLHVQTPTGEFLYDLNRDAHLQFEGPIGIMHVEIADGAARVISSPCREQICVNSRPMTSGGDWTACLPNRVFLEVTGKDETEVDAFSY